MQKVEYMSEEAKSRVTHTYSISQNLTHIPVSSRSLKHTCMLQFVLPRVHVIVRIYLSRTVNPNSSCIHSPPAASSLVAVARMRIP